MKTYTESELAAVWDAGYQWCFDDGGITQNPYRTLPIMIDVDQTVRWFGENDSATTVENIATAGSRVGRNKMPSLLAQLWNEGLLSDEAASALVGPAWSDAEYPDSYLDALTWLFLFSKAGYTVDGIPASRPLEPITLYRGAVPQRSADWSWTDDKDVAQGYASGTSARRPKGQLFSTLAPPEALLCRNTARGESEYVVNTEGLAIVALPPQGAA